MSTTAPRNLSYSVYYEEAPEGGYVASVPVLPGERQHPKIGSAVVI